MKKNYTAPSIKVKKIIISSLLIGSGDNQVESGTIDDASKIAAKEGFGDFDADDYEE